MASFAYLPGQKLLGAVFEITSKQARQLDKFEGISSGSYSRCESITLNDLSGKPITYPAYTYIASPEKGGPFIPSPKYLRKILKGAAECSLPQEHRLNLYTLATSYYPDLNFL